MLPQNPFVVRREIAFGEPFCDREQELRAFLEAAAADEAICLLSPRRYGKSSLVNQVLGRLAEQGWITLRLDLMTIRSLAALVEAFERKRLEASGTWTRLKERVLDVAARVNPQVAIDPETATPTFSLDFGNPRSGDNDALIKAVERISTLPGTIDRPVCLALDEFQEVAALDPKGGIAAMLRSVLQRRSRGFLPIYLGSRRHMLKLMFENENAPFYRSARMLELKELGAAEFAAFMREQFLRTTSRQLPLGIGKATADVFGGHPHALNLAASRLWAAHQLGGSLAPDVLREEWKTVVGTLIDEERAYYQQINRSLSRTALHVLANIARRGVVSAPYSTEFAKSCRLTPGQIQTALKVLVKEDKVLHTEEGFVVMDPLEALCLRTETISPEVRSQELERVLERSAAQEQAALGSGNSAPNRR